MSQQGYGCMGLSAFYASARNTTDEQAVAVFHKAVAEGVTLFNTATFYGPLNVQGYGANLRLIKKCLVGIDRSKIQLMVKIGMDTKADMDKTGTRWVMSGNANSLQEDVNYALQELGVDYIDIIVLCRVPTDVSIEEAVETMKSIVASGKAKHIGLSEASANTLRRAQKVCPIYCIEQEWSLWSRDIEQEVVPVCRELGIKIVAYSPLGRGFLTGSIRSREELSKDPYDYRLMGQPRFAEENFSKNLALVDALKSLAEKKHCSVGQLSLAWVHSQGEDVIPIPGTSQIPHLLDNLFAQKVVITEEDKKFIDSVFTQDAAIGTRYPHMQMTFHGNL